MADVFYNLVKQGDIQRLQEALEKSPNAYLSTAVSAAIIVERVDMLELLLAQPRAEQRGAMIGLVEERLALLSADSAMLAFVLDQRGARANVDRLFEEAVRERRVPAARLLRERASKKRVEVLMLDDAFAEDWRYVETYKPPRKPRTVIAAVASYVGDSIRGATTSVAQAFSTLITSEPVLERG